MALAHFLRHDRRGDDRLLLLNLDLQPADIFLQLSDQPILFENIVEKPGFRLCDILVKTRRAQARALGTSPQNYLRTLAYRLRQPPRGFKIVSGGSKPLGNIRVLGKQIDRPAQSIGSRFVSRQE